MAPHGEAISSGYKGGKAKPPRLTSESLSRTVSDISFELSREGMGMEEVKELPAISEVEDAKCECCGMSEECTPEYIERVRERFEGKWVCGLCAEAVKEELEKNGGNKGEALRAHMSACVRFNKFGRAYPVLFQAQAMREMFKKSALEGRAKSISPRDTSNPAPPNKPATIARSSSCIPAITRDIHDLTLAN